MRKKKKGLPKIISHGPVQKKLPKTSKLIYLNTKPRGVFSTNNAVFLVKKIGWGM